MIGAIRVTKVIDAQTVAASGTYTSATIYLSQIFANGHFSLHVELTGDGTGKFEYQLSNNNSNFVTNTGADDIVTAHTKTSGPGSDGIDIYDISPDLAAYMKIKVTETGGANNITVNAWFANQE